MKKYQAVFFDFDGVILDSVNVKTKAFAKMFAQYGPNIEQKVVEYHLANGGVSRFEKFRYYYKTFLNKTISKKEIQELSVQFSNLVVQDVINSNYIEGASETLETLKVIGIPAYVISGTPHEEIVDIVTKKGLAELFIEVHGSPQKKWEIASDIIDRKGYKPSQCLFFGDAMSDYEAAKKTGMQFLGIVLEDSESPFPKGTKISNAVYVSW